MNLSENSESLFINNLPLDFSVTAGFTKPVIEGIDVRNDIKRIFVNCDVSYLNQIHSSSVYNAERPGVYTADGITTRVRNIVVVIRTADCLPIFVFDNKNKKIGLIHMGWRSAEAGILDNIDIDFKYSYVVAGVGLRKCCYEVGGKFLHIEGLSSFIEKRNQKLYLDIISFARNVLLRHGLQENNFYDLGICSLCDKNKFFSYRRDKTAKRTLSFAVIR